MRSRLAARQAQMAKRGWRYLSLRGLSPRDRVRYFYLSMLRRAAQQGFGRRPSATPQEYEETFARNVPEAAEQVRELTEAFVEARYSEHDVTREHVNMVQAAWKAVKRALLVRRRAAAASPPAAKPVEADGKP